MNNFTGEPSHVIHVLYCSSDFSNQGDNSKAIFDIATRFFSRCVLLHKSSKKIGSQVAYPFGVPKKPTVR